ncbi:MAG: hypothetical protein JNL90_18555 [Planctomycetes bacterium]|nr:hypothetical protein [Planctomycetota bacterium]
MARRLPLLALLLTPLLLAAAPADAATHAHTVNAHAVHAHAALERDDGKPHRHTWVKRTRKEWVPPEKKLVQVGTDAAGKPIYELRIVKPGYWKTISYEACSCGATKG